MSDTDSTATDQAAAGQTSAGTEPEIDWQAEARKWEKRAKENHKRVQELEPKASQYDVLEAASKTDLERAQEQIAALQQQSATNERQALIASVALDKGLPASLARRLQGESKEDLEADADELLSQFGTTNQTTTRSPAPDHSQGSSANGGSAGTPADQFASLIKSMPG